jgi:hypothetical protein
LNAVEWTESGLENPSHQRAGSADATAPVNNAATPGAFQPLLNDYVRYYHDDRTHLSLAKETPLAREAVRRSDVESRIVAVPKLGGLHHRYDLAA